MQEEKITYSELTYALSFGGKEKDEEETLVVPNKESLIAYLYMLDNSLVTHDSKSKEHMEKIRLEVLDKPKITPLDKEYLLKCLEKINFSIYHGQEALVIDKNLVHKALQENVMISKMKLPINTKVDLFLGDVKHTAEIILDHINQEHIEAILLTELCRQSAMVSLTEFLGSDSEYFIIEEHKKYRYFVTRSEDILIHTLPVKGKKNKGIGLCLFTVYQNSKLCMSGYFSVMYNQKEVCK